MVSAHIRKLISLFSFYLRSVEEGKVACFLLATTGFVKMRSSIMKKKMISEVSSLPQV